MGKGGERDAWTQASHTTLHKLLAFRGFSHGASAEQAARSSQSIGSLISDAESSGGSAARDGTSFARPASSSADPLNHREAWFGVLRPLRGTQDSSIRPPLNVIIPYCNDVSLTPLRQSTSLRARDLPGNSEPTESGGSLHGAQPRIMTGTRWAVRATNEADDASMDYGRRGLSSCCESAWAGRRGRTCSCQHVRFSNLSVLHRPMQRTALGNQSTLWSVGCKFAKLFCRRSSAGLLRLDGCLPAGR